MKRFIGMFMVGALLSIFVGCASTGNAKNLAVVKQNADKKLPLWVNTDMDYDMAQDILDYCPKKKGVFATGRGKLGDETSSETTARLDARANLAAQIDTYVKRTAETDKKTFSSESIKEVSEASLKGSRRLDRYLGPDGTVYVLMYLSNENLEESAAETLKDKEFAKHMIELIETKQITGNAE